MDLIPTDLTTLALAVVLAIEFRLVISMIDLYRDKTPSYKLVALFLVSVVVSVIVLNEAKYAYAFNIRSNALSNLLSFEIIAKSRDLVIDIVKKRYLAPAVNN